MKTASTAPHPRAPQTRLQKWRRKAACVQLSVAIAIVISICTLLYAIAHDPSVASLRLGGLA